jgi:hypothetical protein
VLAAESRKEGWDLRTRSETRGGNLTKAGKRQNGENEVGLGTDGLS